MKKILTILLCLVISASLFAAEDVRSMGMGGQHVTDYSDIYTIQKNPAGLGFADKHNLWLNLQLGASGPLMDFYELTMSNGYFNSPLKDTICYFDLFYRTNPKDGGYAIFCGLESIVNYINELHFTKEDIEYLRSKNTFTEEFLEYLLNFKFKGDIYAFKEGSIIFPNEPILTIKATTIEAQIIAMFLIDAEIICQPIANSDIPVVKLSSKSVV